MYRGFTCHKFASFLYFVCFVTVDALEKLDYDPSISIFMITRNPITVDEHQASLLSRLSLPSYDILAGF